MMQSTAASNRIENIKTSDKRLRDILAGRIEPKNRDEREIAGYGYVLDMINAQHEGKTTAFPLLAYSAASPFDVCHSYLSANIFIDIGTSK